MSVTFEMLRSMARFALLRRHSIPLADWTVQGFGFLRLRVSEVLRMHVWDSRLRYPGVSDIHDHTQWAFTSTILSGRLVNVRFDINKTGVPHHMATIRTGLNGGMESNAALEDVNLLPCDPELYGRGQSYRQEPDEIHTTMPADGTITMIYQERRDCETARVFWPKGGTWGNALPRQATRDEIDAVGGFALAVFGD